MAFLLIKTERYDKQIVIKRLQMIKDSEWYLIQLKNGSKLIQVLIKKEIYNLSSFIVC
jgi:hypothetical protein